MRIWHKIKQFFGFEKPVVQPPRLRPQEVLAAALLQSSPDAAIARLQAAYAEAEAAWQRLSGASASTSEQLDEQLELLFFCYAKLHPPVVNVIDPEYERLLERILLILPGWMRDGGEVLRTLDQYIQSYEEGLYLTEAKGEYVFARSEHGRYIRFPFMREGMRKNPRRAAAEKLLGAEFHRSWALPYVELGAAVPWNPISFVDLMALIKDRKVALVTDGAGYYGCMDRA